MTYNLYPAIILLQDGKSYKGWTLLNSMITFGEVVFNTGMTGYQEIMTDPSYEGQIMTFTYPEIGNTGINNDDNESKKIHIKGIIAKNFCFNSSNWRQKQSFINYIITNNIANIFGIDTRNLTKHLRNNGVMNGCISSKYLNSNELYSKVNKMPIMQESDLVNKVTTIKKYTFSDYYNQYDSHLKYKTDSKLGYGLKILLIDFGVKYQILSRLFSYGCSIDIVPAHTSYEEIELHNPDGIILSNGPGDPSVIQYGIKTVKKIIEFTNIPIFGICMGHQILSLALEAKTFKLRFGHRGLNHPSGMKQKIEVTSQNHGFAVQKQSLYPNNIYITHLNLNDSTIAAIFHNKKPVFSVQYHPEASPGPHDSDYLFKYFINLIKKFK
uniref:Carbamoyl phosphate synthase small chain n=2 Tax=Gracilariopsis TaxID=2781 RepID=A0A1C9CF22_9FLOR|nr:carbamoyl phosphate synthetase A [Gracilariopsis lemaneiformis]YP_009294715.1 carbamoyl-phosphate synthase arginine-specific small subunit [Gracilariopsis chorda]AJO68361.1 carbamoyl-phosphate synthase arginine-specific [Gracilariopsis lemaneiformis]AML79788.1 carbamoyl phosphate synthetase A [Gracilariopsis lemaneiformis]AOM66975.1 carbamoyl-phosphate synthase arginine-specific small subunit [Gracilariopsis chorda]